jgi:2-hydroxychromene-2-carboxylate isomerase
MQQEKFSPQGWLEVYVITLLATRNSKQTTLRPHLTVVVVRHQHLAILKKTKIKQS